MYETNLPLPRKQQLFANYLAATGDSSKAVIQAGYETKYPSQMALALRKNKRVMMEVERIRKESGEIVAQKIAWDKLRVLEELAVLLAEAKVGGFKGCEQLAAKILETIGKHVDVGAFTADNTQIVHNSFSFSASDLDAQGRVIVSETNKQLDYKVENEEE